MTLRYLESPLRPVRSAAGKVAGLSAMSTSCVSVFPVPQSVRLGENEPEERYKVDHLI